MEIESLCSLIEMNSQLLIQHLSRSCMFIIYSDIKCDNSHPFHTFVPRSTSKISHFISPIELF